MAQLPNTALRQRIGLDDNHYGKFSDQLREKGFRSLGYRNGHKSGDADDLLVQKAITDGDFKEIYNTGRGFHIYVSEHSRWFCMEDSGD